jgi:hypothetical protein
VYGTIVAGGLMLTKEQIETTRELLPDLNGEGSTRTSLSATSSARNSDQMMSIETPSASARPDIGENSPNPGTMDRAARAVRVDSKVET